MRPMLALLGALFIAANASPAAAEYPTKPIQLIVPAPPGGASDTLARIIGQKMHERWGQPVVVEPRAGASGVIGGDMVAKSKPDGYTLLLISGLHTVTPSLNERLPYDPVADFAAISPVAASPMILVVHPSVPVHSVQELIDHAKAHPGELSFGSSGLGAPSHLSGELFKKMAGVDMLHVPYKGGGQATTDLLGGHISLIFNNPLSTIPLVKSEQLRALAVTGRNRLAALPEVPAVAESGLPGFEVTAWWGVLAPAGTPPDIVAKLNGAITEILQQPDVVKRLSDLGAETYLATPEEYAAFIEADIERWRNLVKESDALVK